jgi:hypothetical protein
MRRRALGAILVFGFALAVYLGRFTFTRIDGLFGAFLAGQYAWLSGCFAATFFVHILTLEGRPRRLLLYVATVAEAPTILHEGFGIRALYPFGLGLAVASVGFRAFLAVTSRSDERRHHAEALFDSLVPPYFGFVSPVFLACTGVFLPRVADLQMQNASGVLGALPPVLVGRFFAAAPVLKGLCAIVYATLPVGIAVVHAIRLKRDADAPPRMFNAFVLIALFGYPLYFVLPMVGPREAWAALDAHAVFPPAHIPAVSDAWIPVEWQVPRNCVPSLHTAWGLSIFLACRGASRRLFFFGLAWFACTELATLGLGEHWLVDIVVAFPFTFAVDALSMPEKLRARDAWKLVALSLMTAAWFALLVTRMSFLGDHPVLSTIMMVATVALSVVLGLSLPLNVAVRKSGGETSFRRSLFERWRTPLRSPGG